MKSPLSLLILLFAISIQAIAQNGKITGTILDPQGETIIGATVKVTGSEKGTVTDTNGKFVIEGLESGEYSIVISFVGHENQKISKVKVTDGEFTEIGMITLTPSTILLEEVVISPGSYTVMESLQATNQLTFSEQSIKNMAWAEDITRSVARLPGISSSDYSSKFSIRGGEADEVLISIDGMELLEPFHQRDYSGGLFSIVDIEAIRGIDLMTGGFSSVYGNRLSGVFNMKTKNVADDTYHLSLGLSIMNARAYADGKFASNKGSYLVSFRRGMLDQSLKIIGDDEYFPKFYDTMSKVEFKLNNMHSISANVLHSGDRAYINNSPDSPEFDEFDTKYNNTYTWLTLNSIYGPKLNSRNVIYYGDVNQTRKGGFDKYDNSDKGYFGVDDKRKYNYFGLKQDWNWALTEKINFDFGFEAKRMFAEYHHLDSINELRVDANEQVYSYQRFINADLSPKGEQVGAYVNARFKIFPKLISETGIRYDYTSYSGDKNWSPRASLLYAFNRRTFARVGWGYYYQSQFINAMDINNGNTQFDPYELAKHYVVSFEHTTNNGINFRTELYYKDYSNVSPLWQNLRDHLENYPEARNDNVRVVFDGIQARGIEFFLKYDEGRKVSWWISYALAEAMDDVQSIEFDGLLTKKTGRTPRLNNQYHTIYTDVNYRPNNKWHLSASWVFYYGWPRTDYTYRITTLPNGDLHFYQVHGVFNDVYYPPYHRLDLRVNKIFNTKIGQITAFLHVVNAYNRENLKKFDLDTTDDNENLSIDANGNYVPFRDDVYWLPILPVIGMKWEIQK